MTCVINPNPYIKLFAELPRGKNAVTPPRMARLRFLGSVPIVAVAFAMSEPHRASAPASAQEGQHDRCRPDQYRHQRDVEELEQGAETLDVQAQIRLHLAICACCSLLSTGAPAVGFCWF